MNNFITAQANQLRCAQDDSELARKYIVDALLHTEQQRIFQKELLEFGKIHDDWLYRSCLTGHLTGSGLVLDSSRQRVLLVHHRKLANWFQPGGHCDGDGNLANVAMREVVEETGLTDFDVMLPACDIDIHSFPAKGAEPEHLHLDVRFLLTAGNDALVADKAETLGAQWVPFDDDRVAHAGLQTKIKRLAALV